MIPRSLSAAISIGALAAVILGVVIEWNNSEGIDLRTDGPAITLTVQQDVYTIGESVLVTLHNSGILGIDFENDTYYGIRITQLDGILVYAPQADTESSSLEVGQSVTFVWDQTKTSGKQVNDGIYRIFSEGASSDGLKVSDSITVNIHR